MYLTQDYQDIIELFNKYGVRYLIAGAYAMSQVGYSRSTYDIDLWVDKSEENAQNIYKALDEFGVPFAVEPDNFLEPNSVLQIGIAPNRIDILTDIDGLTFEQAWKGDNLLSLTHWKPSRYQSTTLSKTKKHPTDQKTSLIWRNWRSWHKRAIASLWRISKKYPKELNPQMRKTIKSLATQMENVSTSPKNPQIQKINIKIIKPEVREDARVGVAYERSFLSE